MSKPSRVRTLFLLLAAVGTTLTLSAGCAKQSEGERCSPVAAGDQDCEDGLVCWSEDDLGVVDTKEDFGRCCPPRGQHIGDERCIPRLGPPGGTGGMGNAGAGGAAEGGSSSEGGATTATGGVSTEGGATSSGGSTSTEGGSSAGGSSSGGAGGA